MAIERVIRKIHCRQSNDDGLDFGLPAFIPDGQRSAAVKARRRLVLEALLLAEGAPLLIEPAN